MADYTLTENDKNILKAAVQLVWAKGAHNPQESNIAVALTQLTERAHKEDAPKDKPPMLANRKHDNK